MDAIVPVLVLPLLFLGTGLLGIWYYHAIPDAEAIRSRLPNRVSWAAWVMVAAIGVGGWYIITRLSTPFQKIGGVTTLLFYLLVFETVFFLLMRWLRSNLAAVTLALTAAVVPFAIQLSRPSYALINLIIIIATLGATTLMVRLKLLRTRIIVLMTVLLAFNDAINVWYVLPRLPLAPLPPEPLPFLILPTVSIAGRVVGSGDFMFLALTTVVLLRDFSRRTASLHVGAQAIALLVTLTITAGIDVLIPYLLVMAPIFLITYIVAWKSQKQRGSVAGAADTSA